MKIAVIDFESRFTKNILDKLDSINVDHYLFRHDVNIKELENFDALIFTGSYDTVYDGGRLIDPAVFEINKPIFGICYGHQLVHYLLGGKVDRAKTAELEPVEINMEDSLLFKGLPRIQKVEMHHYDEVVELAPGFRCIASENNCRFGASENKEKKIYTVQFHPEADNNDYGKEIFENFIDIVKNI